MSSVFISYKRGEDEGVVRELRAALLKNGLTVFWDQDTPGGEPWRETLLRELDAASCVLVLWSHSSTGEGNEWVREEAERARKRRVLVPVRIDESEPPFGFAELQTLNLVGWRGRAEDVRFQDVLAAVRAKLNREKLPVPRWPSLRRRRRVLQGALGIAAVIVVTVTAASPDLIGRVCTVPGVRGACLAAAIGHVPSPKEKRAWDVTLRSRDPAPLRAYLEEFPSGAFADAARARLGSCHQERATKERLDTKHLELELTPAEVVSPSEASARRAALEAGRLEAARLCATYESQLMDVKGTSFEATVWHCRTQNGGTSCGFSGTAVCELSIHEVFETEICP